MSDDKFLILGDNKLWLIVYKQNNFYAFKSDNLSDVVKFIKNDTFNNQPSLKKYIEDDKNIFNIRYFKKNVDVYNKLNKGKENLVVVRFMKQGNS